MVQSIRYKVPASSQTWLNQIAINYISRCKYSVKYRPGHRWDPREKENETRNSTIAGFPPNSESHAFYATPFSRLCNFVRLIRDGSFVSGFLSLSRFRRTFGNTATVADDFSASQVSLLYSRGTARAITTLISLRRTRRCFCHGPNESAYAVDQSAIRDLQFTCT